MIGINITRDKKRIERERKQSDNGFRMALVKARQARHMTIEAVSRELGMADGTYTRIENGEAAVKPSRRQQIATYFGIEERVLFPEPFLVRCRTCKKLFEPENDQRTCQECKAKAAGKNARKTLRYGDNQKLISADCRKAKEAGYGHSYGKWRAGVII